MHSRFTTISAALAWLYISSVPVNAFPAIEAPNATPRSVDIKSVLTSPSNKWAANTIISFPGSAQFANTTERWTLFDAPTYAAAISPGTEADLVKAVKLVRQHNIPFMATGGGHSYTTTIRALQNGLDIHLEQFDTVQIDKIAHTVTVGGGALNSQVIEAVYDAGFWMQTGSATCPGFVGVTLGGGVGRFTGLYGLEIDALLSVQMITAEGELVQASETVNSDLFWGIRGAGFNFGIITSVVLTIHPLQNHGTVMSADMIFPANYSTAYFKALQSYSGSMPELLATITLIEYDPISNGPQILANWIYLGTEEAGRKALAPILDLNPPILNITQPTWKEMYYTGGFGFDLEVCIANVTRNLYTNVLRKLSASTFDAAFAKIEKLYKEYPSAANGSSIEFEIFPNQAMSAISNDATAYPYRDAVGYVVQSYSGWLADDTATSEAAAAFAVELREDFSATSGYPDLAIYVNYAHGDETLEQKYSAEKLPRLVSLKKTWDPDNVFGWNNALPTSYP